MGVSDNSPVTACTVCISAYIHNSVVDIHIHKYLSIAKIISSDKDRYVYIVTQYELANWLHFIAYLTKASQYLQP